MQPLTLDQIALKHGTDKASNVHGYTKYYEKFFEPLRHQPITLWEAGFGGYHYPDRGGQSARTWREYFTKANIVVTDIHKKDSVADGVTFMIGSQDDRHFWDTVIMKTRNMPDIFIDDASHINPLTIRTFESVFRLLTPGGIYVIEDLESSWWEDIAVDGTDFHGKKDPYNTTFSSTINFLRWLVNDVNHPKIQGYVKKYDIESIHFYHNIAFIIKKK